MEDPTIMCITFKRKVFTKSKEKEKKKTFGQPQGLKAFFKISFFLSKVLSWCR